MLELSNKTNLLEQKIYKYELQDVADPNLYRDIYSYDSVPKVAFNHRRVPMGMPEEIWITDTSLRDGQQSVEPYTVKQIVAETDNDAVGFYEKYGFNIKEHIVSKSNETYIRYLCSL